MEAEDLHPDDAVEPSRRTVLMTGSLLVGLAAAGCTPTLHASEHDDDVTAPDRGPHPPDSTPETFEYLSAEEARTVDAVVGRIIPGDESDPGAVLAGVTIYIDHMLASFESFAEPTFMAAPFAAAVAAGERAAPAPDEIAVPEEELYRYGHQSRLTAREVYGLGLAALDRYAQTRYGALFADLSPERQDELLLVLDEVGARSEDDESGELSESVLDQAVDIFGDVDPGEFFSQVRSDTIAGMFADPAYGGNRNLVGWQLIGYPGAQRSYSTSELRHGTRKQPQAMLGMPAMNPDRPGGGTPALERHQHGVGTG